MYTFWTLTLQTLYISQVCLYITYISFSRISIYLSISISLTISISINHLYASLFLTFIPHIFSSHLHFFLHTHINFLHNHIHTHKTLTTDTKTDRHIQTQTDIMVFCTVLFPSYSPPHPNPDHACPNYISPHTLHLLPFTYPSLQTSTKLIPTPSPLPPPLLPLPIFANYDLQIFPSLFWPFNILANTISRNYTHTQTHAKLLRKKNIKRGIVRQKYTIFYS